MTIQDHGAAVAPDNRRQITARDAVRAFTAADRRHLYVRAGGRCERCDTILHGDWEAHHVRRWADGGPTTPVNGMALCSACHRAEHASSLMNIELRNWQQLARNRVAAREENLLIEAGVGAGKTTMAAVIAMDEIAAGRTSFVLCVVPTTPLKTSFMRTFASIGVQITPTLRSGQGKPVNFDGGVVTYGQLPHMLSTLETWSRNGTRILLIFDEIHHCAGGDSEANQWGTASENAARYAYRVISMSGTPFRSDGRRISFLRYAEDGRALADILYSYAESVSDGWCRPVMFMHDDSVASYTYAEKVVESRVSSSSNGQRGMVSATVFQPESEFLQGVIVKAKRKLEELRLTDVDAACLVVCRPGRDDEDDRHMLKVAKSIEALTGDTVVTVSHEDKEAAAKIEAFNKSQDKWLCSVRMVSEGINIPRLRVLVLATATDSEMLFRQIVGRIVRQEDPAHVEEATAYLAKFPHLVEFASRFRAEALAGLEQKERRQKVEGSGDSGAIDNGFQPLRASHEDGGGIAHGERYTPAEINTAERMKNNDVVLSATPLHVIAHLLRKSGFKPDAGTPTGELPLHERQKRRRDTISALLRQLGVTVRDATNDPHAFAKAASFVWSRIGVRDLNDLIDNHPEATADAAIRFIEQQIAGAGGERAA